MNALNNPDVTQSEKQTQNASERRVIHTTKQGDRQTAEAC